MIGSSKLSAALLPLICFGAFPSASVAESWTDSKGRTLEAEFVRIDGSDVILRVGKREHKVPLNTLNPDSRSQAEEFELRPRVAPMDIAEVEKFRARRDALRRAREKLKRERSDLARLIDVFFLQSFSLLERDLALLATPEDRAEVPDALSKVRWLRQRIRDGERELGRNRLGKTWTYEPLKFVGPTELVRRLYDWETELDGIYSDAVGALEKKIRDAAKDLKRERSGFKREATISRLEGEIAGARAEMGSLAKTIYAFPPGGAFGTLAATEIPEVEELRGEIRAERDAILKDLRGAGGAGARRGDIESGEVGGYEVFSAKLGVILDVSGSMSNHIARLKKEIAESFTSPVYRDITGCALIPGLSPEHQTMLAIEELIAVHGVDSVYWFCDLRDGRALASVRHLRYLLRSSGASFYLKSVGQQPSEILKSLMAKP